MISFFCSCGLKDSVAEDGFPVHCACGAVFACPAELPKGGPSLAQRGWNFTAAMFASAARGNGTVDDAEFERRGEACRTCLKWFSPQEQICTHQQCGCRVAGQESNWWQIGRAHV